MGRSTLAAIVSGATVTFSVSCGGMTDGMGHLPLANTEDSSVADAGVRGVRPGRTDASEVDVTPSPLGSPCDDGAVCIADGGTLTVEFSAEACARLPVGCDTGADPRTFRNELWQQCVAETRLIPICTAVEIWWEVDAAGCTKSFSRGLIQGDPDGAMQDCFIRRVSSFRWLCIAGTGDAFYSSCSH